MEEIEGFVLIALNAKGEVLPPKNDLIALIDADTILFAAASTCEVSMDILPREFYHEDEWNDIVNDPDFDEENGVIYNMDQEQALKHCESKLDQIMEATGCKAMELHFSGGRDNFRYSVMPTYKSNRLGMHAPAGLRELKEAMIKKWGGEMHTTIEADDYVVSMWWKRPEKYLVCAVDKDVLGSVPHAFNYYFKAATTRKGKSYAEIPMKFVDYTENEVTRHPYFQCLMGDSNDGIQGIFGCGKVGANKILNSADSQEEVDLWKAVVEAYERADMSELDAIQTMQLVNMRQIDIDAEGYYEIKRWLPKFNNLSDETEPVQKSSLDD